MAQKPPVLHDVLNKRFYAAQDQDTITSASVPVSSADGNVVKKDVEGVYALPGDMVSAVADNRLEVAADMKLFVAPVDIPMPDIIISDRADNLLRLDAAGHIHLSADDVLSNQAGNSLGVSSSDSRVFFGKDSPVDWISAMDDNMLELGTDGKLLLRRCRIIEDTTWLPVCFYTAGIAEVVTMIPPDATHFRMEAIDADVASPQAVLHCRASYGTISVTVPNMGIVNVENFRNKEVTFTYSGAAATVTSISFMLEVLHARC